MSHIRTDIRPGTVSFQFKSPVRVGSLAFLIAELTELDCVASATTPADDTVLVTLDPSREPQLDELDHVVSVNLKRLNLQLFRRATCAVGSMQ